MESSPGGSKTSTEAKLRCRRARKKEWCAAEMAEQREERLNK